MPTPSQCSDKTGQYENQAGIVMMLNLGIGLVTPPVGTVLFVGCAVGKVSVERASRHLWPFWLAMVVVLLLVTYNPELALWIPGLLYPR